ncbi:TRCF domain-containing protein [Mesorhizobium sp. M0488]|uniref:TRCF domain-containing protein n=1 Tax=unclassified Mesorhizobium TaxID=325217 RepID=UPI0033370A9A
MKLIGAGLYQHLLERALSLAGGGADPDKQLADINRAGKGSLPETYVNEPTVRVGLYSRLSRMRSEPDLDAFSDELEDRFGNLPGEVAALLELTRLRIAAGGLGVGKVDVGPQAIAFTFRRKSAACQWRSRKEKGFEVRNGRLIFRLSIRPGVSEVNAVRLALSAMRAAQSSDVI